VKESFDPNTQPLLPEDLDLEIKKIMSEYTGDADILERALGALLISRFYGWHVARLLHTPATYRKYEKALDLKYSEKAFSTTTYSKKSRLYVWARDLNKVWQVIRGQFTREDRPPSNEFVDGEVVS